MIAYLGERSLISRQGQQMEYYPFGTLPTNYPK